jgi:hypothetical protein
MYLFSRRAQLSGAKLRDAMGWAVAAGERVTQTTGLPIGVWSQVYSPGVGTLVWATFVPDLATLEGATDKLAVDDAYNELGDRAVEFVLPGTIDDSLSIVVHGEPDPNRQIEYVASVRTTIVAGKIAKGMALGVEIAQKAEEITGVPTLFLGDATGNYGGVGWLTAFADVAALEAAEMALNTNESFIDLIDKKVGGVYADVPGASTQLIYRRVSG